MILAALCGNYYYDLNDRITEMSFLDQLDDKIDIDTSFQPTKFDIVQLISALPFFINLILIIGKSYALSCTLKNI